MRTDKAMTKLAHATIFWILDFVQGIILLRLAHNLLVSTHVRRVQGV